MSQARSITLDKYIDRALPASDALLVRLEQQADEEKIPIIGRAGAALIQLLTHLIEPELIVELGTATGYSAIWLLRGWPKARLLSFEIDQALADQARQNLRVAGLADRADVRTENAVDALEGLEPGSADIVFNDILNGLRDEARVDECFQRAITILKPGGLLLADNALASGEVTSADSREARCVRRWNERVAVEPSLTGMILPVGDGLSVAVVAGS
jgi:caffeoyl-CoA O-methyltransferase